MLELATQFFEARLVDREGVQARTYLAGRQVTPALQKQFRLGYSPADRYALRDHLAGRGIGREAMIEAGLLVHGEDIAVPYDRFRDRVIFPIHDRSGRVIAFGGRAMEKDVQAKYLNSPETPLFHKGQCLYNHHRARKAAHETGRVIVVEGYMDVIGMAGAGIAECVAPLGTALTPEPCELLWRMAEEPILCFDGDKAGRKAAYRAIDTALPLIEPGRSMRFALLPEGRTPTISSRSAGPAGVADVLNGAHPLVELLWMRETEGRASSIRPSAARRWSSAVASSVQAIRDERCAATTSRRCGARLAPAFRRPPAPAARAFSRRTTAAGRPVRPKAGAALPGAAASTFSPHPSRARRACVAGRRARARGGDPLDPAQSSHAIRAHVEDLAELDSPAPEAPARRALLIRHAAARLPRAGASAALEAAGFEPVAPARKSVTASRGSGRCGRTHRRAEHAHSRR